MITDNVSHVTPEGTVAARPIRIWSRAGIALTFTTTVAEESGAPCRGLAAVTTVVSEAGEVKADAIRWCFLTRVANMPTLHLNCIVDDIFGVQETQIYCDKGVIAKVEQSCERRESHSYRCLPSVGSNETGAADSGSLVRGRRSQSGANPPSLSLVIRG